MAESFEALLEESFQQAHMQEGATIPATILAVDSDYVTVNVGLKGEGFIPVSQFRNEEGKIDVAVGDEVEVVLESIDNGLGEPTLSREKAKREKVWRDLESAYSDGSTVMGKISNKVKGGFTVLIRDVRAFLPGSLVDVRPIKDLSDLEDKDLEFKVIKMDHKRNNIVVSRRAVVQEESSAERSAILENLTEGEAIKGIVKNLTDYGAFIDLGGVDGLLHITDIAWKRVKHPSEVLTVGQEVDVKVLRFERDRNRISLGMKQLSDDPWQAIGERYPENSRWKGKVTNITDYGCFVELEDGVEGLVHMSEMDWTNKNVHPSKIVQLGDEVEVMVLQIDEERRRISLGMKQCQANPWEMFAANHQKGEKISGKIKSITDFGVFIGLEGNIDGLIHLTDLSWKDAGEEAVNQYKKGDEIEAIILGIDAERERISLGVKQMEGDPFGSFVDIHGKGAIVTGKVIEVDKKQAIVELATDITGRLKASEISQEKVEDVTTVLSVGDEVEAKITQVDKKNRVIHLSIKAKEDQEEAEAIQKYRHDAGSDATQTTSLGDFLKESIETQKEDEKIASDDETDKSSS